jgi:diaminopimelate epimerase
VSETLRAALYAGVDNRFLLFEVEEEHEWPSLARALCAQEHFLGARPDGLLVVTRCDGHDARMVIYNADGGRPEACGNGLRCVGWHLARTRGLTTCSIATDAGPRAVVVEERVGDVATLRAEMGSARELGEIEDLPPLVAGSTARGYDLGNPHCILLVEDERVAPVETVGRAMQQHDAFPNGVNVGFLARREGAWHLRVWERGVGETAACGTNACAAAALLHERDGAAAHTLLMPGGPLFVSRMQNGSLELRGEARAHGQVLLELSSQERE